MPNIRKHKWKNLADIKNGLEEPILSYILKRFWKLEDTDEFLGTSKINIKSEQTRMNKRSKVFQKKKSKT